jgi:hypothetical protein
MPNPTELFGLIVFGIVGSAALLIGKRRQQWKTLLIGAGLILVPYFTTATWQLYTVGVALCAALFVWRD